MINNKDLRDTYNKIPKFYDRANALISFFQDTKWRKKLVTDIFKISRPEKVLDVASGRGELAYIIKQIKETYVVMTDYSENMLNMSIVDGPKVMASFENLPFQDNTFDSVISTFAIHAADNIDGVISEMERVSSGTVGIIALGKSDNRLYRFIAGLYLKYLQPYIAKLAGEKPENYKVIYHIYKKLPLNSTIREITEKYLDTVKFDEKAFGSIYTFIGTKKKNKIY
ncbi:MAG: Methyltransferase type 11 [Candidatus Parvarchaeum acidophilus ARMAN-5]|jgi:demethylmenaquinone methyltransferase/2-methoxy-6-polyprenyl-1,4-benzoquinol methylase|uniref:Methyltransferase type 11 n=1 Tax=Candidatus Parvarchaeum acidophilus ARMAN-5 TaxID=662762 RepID=D6GV96_PARA5|nr:MAG: Methyltransferase type 11 [Candidatus Parvarchaeum acidophilus ARMAN-5]